MTSITMSLPAIITVVLIAMNLVITLFMHGKEVRINFFTSLMTNALTVGLLYWGGFFS